MRRPGAVLTISLLLMSACSTQATTSTSQPATETSSTPELSQPTDTPSEEPADVPPASADKLNDFNVDFSQSFGGEGPTVWEAVPYAGADYSLPVDLPTLSNPQVTANLTDEQRQFLIQNGFVVIHSQEEQFFDIQSQVGRRGQPYYVTVDSALHAVHLGFDDMLKALEREVFYPEMVDITQATLDEILVSLPQTTGTSIEEDTLVAAAYLSVALKLFDPQYPVDSRVQSLVTPQVEQIMAGGGKAPSSLLPTFTDDYGAYKPVGHYAGDPILEQYFRGMSWLGRVHFQLADEQLTTGTPPSPKYDRTPLIITLAMRRADMTDGRPAARVWGDIHEVLTFLVGPSDDTGPLEYAALMDTIYGDEATIADLADNARWQEFTNSAKSELPSPRINSTFVDWVAQLELNTGWRFMGQRFTVDGNIFQQLMFDAVDPSSTGQQRHLPTGPDITAVFGSPVGLDAVKAAGQSDYPNYPDQVAMLQEGVNATPTEEWLSRAYDSWLYTFLSVLMPKDSSYPQVMQTPNWAYREMNTVLGSWAELKHDTILYSKMPEEGGGGGCDPPSSGPPPAYVEPNPDAFYRMAYLTNAITSGISRRSFNWESQGYAPGASADLDATLGHLGRLTTTLQFFGDIAVKELAGQPLTEDDFRSIQRATMVPHYVTEIEPVPIIAAVAGGEPGILEAATGKIDRIYVVVPINGEFMIAQGGVYSYYEFVQPRDNRLTDQEWRDLLASEDAPPLPAWAGNFLFEGGAPNDWLAFRIGDWYEITYAGEGLNVRAEPSIEADILVVLDNNAYLQIIDGPVYADGETWWQVDGATGLSCFSNVVSEEFSGWVVEHQGWYSRSN